jgi:hypothetical protein
MVASSIIDFQTMVAFLADVTHFETSNYNFLSHPHFFVSTYDVPTTTTKFYEQLKDSVIWTEYSATLPITTPPMEISCICTDDQI